MLHHSPTRSRLRAMGHCMLPKFLRCMEPKIGQSLSLCKSLSDSGGATAKSAMPPVPQPAAASIPGILLGLVEEPHLKSTASLAAFTLLASLAAAQAPPLLVRDAWVRATPGADMAAAYL